MERQQNEGEKGEFSPFSIFCLSGALTPIIPNFSIQAEAEAKFIEHLNCPGEQKQECSCKKSRCLKLYCECFSKGDYCINCKCVNCLNVPEAEEIRKHTIQTLLEKNPRVFTMDSTYKVCKCKKNGCLKNYCECYQRGKACSYLCKCKGCHNIDST